MFKRAAWILGAFLLLLFAVVGTIRWNDHAERQARLQEWEARFARQFQQREYARRRLLELSALDPDQQRRAKWRQAWERIEAQWQLAKISPTLHRQMTDPAFAALAYADVDPFENDGDRERKRAPELDLHDIIPPKPGAPPREEIDDHRILAGIFGDPDRDSELAAQLGIALDRQAEAGIRDAEQALDHQREEAAEQRAWERWRKALIEAGLPLPKEAQPDWMRMRPGSSR